MSLLHEVQLLQQQRAAKRQRSQGSHDTPRGSDVLQPTSPPAQDAPADTSMAATRTSAVTLAHPLSRSIDRLSVSSEANFYGSARLSLVELSIQRFLAGVHQRLQEPDPPLKSFPRQADAFDYADEQEQGVARVFSSEISASSGARSYLVSSYERFWRHYNHITAGHRHHYEIIREQTPCHLYFDLEFDRGVNSGCDGNRLSDELLAAIATALQQRFEIQLDQHDTETITELDSTTDVKWSRHLIVRIPGAAAAFASAMDCGAFVSSVLESTGDLFSVYKKGGGTTCFVDCSVYSRNRAFRLYLSSKAGKSAVLNPSGRLAEIDGDTQRSIFMRALICNVDPDCRLLYCARPAPCNDSSARGTPSSSNSHASAPRPESATGQVWRQPPCSHPGVDSFFSQLRAPDGVCGQIRNWAAVGKGVVLVSMRSTRWCGNVGRHHKSNGIYYVIDLAGGTWWQKCFDYDCRSYRSEMRPLPPQICSEEARVSANEGVLAGEFLTDEQVADAAAAEHQATLQYETSLVACNANTTNATGTESQTKPRVTATSDTICT